jgi:hypothetical protein
MIIANIMTQEAYAAPPFSDKLREHIVSKNMKLKVLNLLHW